MSTRTATRQIRVSEENWLTLNGSKRPGESFDDVVTRLLDQVEEKSPELVADGGVTSPFPIAGSAEKVLVDTHGAGEGNITGHTTIHLLHPDEPGPLCQGKGIPSSIREVPRVELAPDIDECGECERIALER